MAHSSGSQETFVNLLRDGLKENETVYKDVLQSSVIDDFFGEGFVPDSETTEKVRLATYEVGTYSPKDVEWKIEDTKVWIRGKQSRRTVKGAEGTHFSRVISIPQEIDVGTVAVRFCVGDGTLIVEGKNKTKTTRKRIKKQSSFFSDASFSLSIDLGDDSPLTLTCGSQTQDGKINRKVELFE